MYRAGSEPAPVLLFLHGGALIFGERSWIHPAQLERYLAAGFTLVSIDYRLAPETKLPGIIEDLRDAWAWIRERGPQLFSADPDRIGVVGHSAGGYLTLMSGFCVAPRPRALVSFYGYGDLIGEWYSKPDPFYGSMPAVPEREARALESRDRFYLYCRQQGIWPREVGGRDPGVEPDFFTPYCPEQNVDREWPPTLLLHGEADNDVPYELSRRMASALERAGALHELITSPGGHGFDGAMEQPDAARAFDAVIGFLTQKVQLIVSA